MKLSDAKLRTLAQAGKHFDGGGLYLEVTANGGRYWRLKYRHAAKEKRLALGVYPEVSLKEAREQRDAARAVLRRGEDPGALRRAAKVAAVQEAANTFADVAKDWLAHQSGRWEAVTLERIESAFKADVYPRIGSTPMAKIKPGEVAAIAKAIEARGSGDMAARVLQRIKAVFRFAIVHGRMEANPMLDLRPGELLKPRQVVHRAAMPEREVPAFLSKLAAYDGDASTACALRLLMLTVVRPGELRGACWSELDLGAALWRIPAERMKMRDAHVVPLSRQAIELLKSLRPSAMSHALVFPSPYYPGQMLSENTLNSALARMGYKGLATAHGFRALFSTVANEAGWDGDVIERQLAHVERNQSRAAYHRATYLRERAKLMQWWADHLGQLRRGADVVPIGRAAA